MNASCGYWAGFIAAVLVLICVEVVTTARPVPAQPSRQASVHLPTACAQFYQDGTDRWVECMGVGYK